MPVSLFRVHSKSGFATLIATTFSGVQEHGEGGQKNTPGGRCTVLAVEAETKADLGAVLAFLDTLLATDPGVYITIHGVDAPMPTLRDAFWVTCPGTGGVTPGAAPPLLYTHVRDSHQRESTTLSARCDSVGYYLPSLPGRCHLPMVLRDLGLLRPYDTELSGLGENTELVDLQNCIGRLRWC